MEAHIHTVVASSWIGTHFTATIRFYVTFNLKKDKFFHWFKLNGTDPLNEHCVNQVMNYLKTLKQLVVKLLLFSNIRLCYEHDGE